MDGTIRRRGDYHIDQIIYVKEVPHRAAVSPDFHGLAAQRHLERDPYEPEAAAQRLSRTIDI
jgi:hypothetical protein